MRNIANASHIRATSPPNMARRLRALHGGTGEFPNSSWQRFPLFYVRSEGLPPGDTVRGIVAAYDEHDATGALCRDRGARQYGSFFYDVIRLPGAVAARGVVEFSAK